MIKVAELSPSSKLRKSASNSMMSLMRNAVSAKGASSNRDLLDPSKINPNAAGSDPLSSFTLLPEENRSIRYKLEELNQQMGAPGPSSPDYKPSRIVTALIIGCGNRGESYATFALDHPERMKVVAVCDPIQERRERMADLHNVPVDMRFHDWTLLLDHSRLADVVIVATPDRAHHKPVTQLVKLGYHILVEKPMAVTERECLEITKAMQASPSTVFAVCHVLRYTPANRLMAALIRSGAIGELVNIQHLEPVGFYHFAHSYVRGNWNNSSTATFSLMAKSCHDIDLIRYWMGGSTNPALRVSSFGSLKHFRAKNKPTGASDRCLTCPREPDCAYSAKKIYLTPLIENDFKGWPVSTITPGIPDVESVERALETGPFGRCVYDSDNDVCDHQVVQMDFAGGQTASFTMVAFSEKLCKRQTKVFGSRGELTCIDGTCIRHFDFASGQSTLYTGSDITECGRLIGHDGADYYLMDSFIRAIAEDDRSLIGTGPQDALDSHLLVFAAERSRYEGRVVLLPAARIISQSTSPRFNYVKVQYELENAEEDDYGVELKLKQKLTFSSDNEVDVHHSNKLSKALGDVNSDIVSEVKPPIIADV